MRYHASRAPQRRIMAIDLAYWSASRNDTTRRLFDPYALASVHHGWYAIGHCHPRVDIRMFAIQRVESLRETGEFKRWVMWWGTDCEVVEPKALRQSITVELTQMLRNEEGPLTDRAEITLPIVVQASRLPAWGMPAGRPMSLSIFEQCI